MAGRTAPCRSPRRSSTPTGTPATYVLAGSFSLLAAVLILFLRQPTAVPAMRPALAGETSKT